MKFATNIHHVSGQDRKDFQGQTSTVKVVTHDHTKYGPKSTFGAILSPPQNIKQ